MKLTGAEAQKIVWEDTEDWKKVLRQTDLLETEVLALSEDGKLTKAILRKSQRQIEARISWNVFRRDGYRCRYCGRGTQRGPFTSQW